LQKASLAVAPIAYGAGIQNKVLEAMACQTPVVTSPQAVSALDVQPGKDVLVSDGPEPFAEHILHLLDDPIFSRQIGQAGRKYVETHHHWPAVAGQFEDLYREVVGELRSKNIRRQK
jgi:glycosyltransferase involved in cell wall biosynthesis